MGRKMNDVVFWDLNYFDSFFGVDLGHSNVHPARESHLILEDGGHLLLDNDNLLIV